MLKCTCRKCGMRAISKNPATRSVFPKHDNHWVELLPTSMYATMEVDKYRTSEYREEKDLVIRMSTWADRPEPGCAGPVRPADQVEALKLLHRRLMLMTEDEFAQALCIHSWQIDPGQPEPNC